MSGVTSFLSDNLPNCGVRMMDLQSEPIAALMAEDALSPHNRRVFDYWRSLRRGDALPCRADFNPAHVRFALSRLTIIGARRGDAGYYRLLGTAITLGLGFDPTGLAVSRMTTPSFLRTRVQRYERILGGQALRVRRLITTTAGRIADVQDLALPFGDEREDGSRDVLITTDVTHEMFGERCTDPMDALGAPTESAFFELYATSGASRRAFSASDDSQNCGVA